MADEPDSTSIQTKYAEQLAADLAANQAEQATLTVRLGRLQEEEKWLAATLESLPPAAGGEPTAAAGPVSGTVAAGAEPAGATLVAGAGAEEAAVPQPRSEKAGRAASVKKAPAKKATGAKRAAKKAPARKVPAAEETPAAEKAVAAVKAVAGKVPAVKKTGVRRTTTANKAVRPTGPTLGELLKDLLAQQPGEPKKVSEISAELKARHPERATSDQVVRNALERLVAKDGLEKDTRQGLVLYTWPTARASAASSAPAAERSKNGEPAEAALAGA
ncbi:hypothetical protein GCM10010275_55910 [Streptomyces litmocidini]|uniref:hypothetical protein n=1 Tax=Streptomyces litmocidini TaxID=67318 RepID=UPI00167DB2FA|nr:hypothetical protein [Streptomyces litmocidini]GGV08406.1 hypothetical protein GCM10010275_55910 [Streptomyces litmocidini]